MPEEELRVLVLASFDGSDANAIGDFLFSFNTYSRHRYYYVLDCRRLGRDVDLSAFDVILLFWSASLLGPNLGEEPRARIRAARALKVVFVQDEYRDAHRLAGALAELGAQVVFTCVAERDHEAFYPRALIPSLEARYSVLPAYVPEYLEDRLSLDRRKPLDIGYRSREAPFYLGDLARAKSTLAERFEAACRDRRLRVDVSVRELDRLYGAAWIRFLSECRCVLGSPSGASVIDFTGRIRSESERFLARRPAASYGEVRERFFADVDGHVVIDTVSARVFEAVALGCTLVHIEGEYAGVLEPGRHYVSVARDYSNLSEVLDRVEDRAFCRRLAEAAHRDLVASGRYSFRAFIRRFDACLARHAVPARTRSLSRAAFYTRRCLLHGQPLIPFRAGYLAVPVGGAFLAVVLRRLALGRLRPGPLVGRLLRNPGGFIHKLATLAGLLLRVPAMRALLAAHLRERAVRARVPLWLLLEDLLKLDVARRSRAGTLCSPRPFSITVTFEQDTGTLLLASETRSQGAPPVFPGLSRTSCGPAVQQVVWDHSEVGLEVAFATRRTRWMTLSLGPGGVYRFEALSALCRSAPRPAALALDAILASAAGRPEGVVIDQ